MLPARWGNKLGTMSSDMPRCFIEKALTEQLLKVLSDRKNKYMLPLSMKHQLNNTIIVESHRGLSTSCFGDRRMDKNIHTGRPNEKAKMKSSIFLLQLHRLGVFHAESLWSFMKGSSREPGSQTSFQKNTPVSVKKDGYAQPPHKGKKQPFLAMLPTRADICLCV